MSQPTPPAPVVTGATVSLTTAPAAVTVTGTCEVAGTVTVYVDDTPLATTTVTADGSFAVSLTGDDPLAPGDHTVSACVTVAGNETSAWSADVTYEVPSPVPPPVPSP